ncbi:solanesyl diphosphate synthase [Pavlovales sp. CCMP2436]|nr:solanesyl diphosphate synthase [Pavlovales sp. CCMP2436]KAJ1625060.1 solanesyl diphosphate synthase [Pavlovales sp. CCMP2436]|mmetsp:Transcript_23377/g.55389  ORF Transcript_23377/g.55389 Transcript_23377/m.55389 type:complete len:384 (-) Transcript_23377:220-1371(-)
MVLCALRWIRPGRAGLGRIVGLRPFSSSLRDLQRSIDPAHLQFDVALFPPLEPPPSTRVDPFNLVEPDLRPLADSLKDLVGVDHPVLNKVARHFFDMQGKRFRPTILLLVSQALGTPRDSPVFSAQKRLAEIAEMIHTASLIHDDVIDVSDMRRGARSVHKIFGNKVAVLAGDFLLARASVLLARLGDVKVVELMATVLEDMVHGEMMQARAEPEDLVTFEHYTLKNYLKTGSLISLSCHSAAVLTGAPHDSALAVSARDYGRHFGVAYQLVDDLLDFTASEEQLGKPALADMANGLATAPALFAAREFPEMNNIIQRRFSQEKDLEAAYDYVQRSDGIAKSRRLAEVHMQLALQNLHIMPGTDQQVKGALVQLCHDVLNRRA